MSLDLTPVTVAFCECYTIECAGGITAYFTNYSTNLTFLGQTYQAVPIRRGPIRFNSDLQADDMELQIGIIGLTVGVLTYTIPQVIRAGFLRGAKLTIHAVDYATPTNYDTRFIAYATDEVSFDRGSVSISFRSLTGTLNAKKVPGPIYSHDCNWQLFDVNCGLAAGSYDEAGTADAGTTTWDIYDAIFAFSHQDEGYWEKGKITFSTGNNTGISRSIAAHADGYVTVNLAFPFTPAVGNAFTAWPGCDKHGATCVSRFNNYARFMGFEYIPVAEEIL